MRLLMEGLSDEMKAGYREGIYSIARNEQEVALFQKMLDDPIVTSFLRQQFDVAPLSEFEVGNVVFQTMRPTGKLPRAAGGKLARGVRSVLPARAGGKRLTSKPNTMRAFEAGEFDVGPDVTAHYANNELRTRMQDIQARKVLKYGEPIEVKNGIVTLKPGYRIYNYYGIRRAEAKLNEMFLRSKRYGDIADSQEEMLSGDPLTGSIIDMDPDDFTDMAGLEGGGILLDEMVFDTPAKAAAKTEDFLRLMREGKIVQVPDDVIETFINSSGAAYSWATASTAARVLAGMIRIPSMLARWRMIGKLAYPVVNVGATAILVGMNQGPFLGLSIRRTLSLSRNTRIRLLQEGGIGVAELTDVQEMYARNTFERIQRGEQAAFRKAMHVLSLPEAQVRLTQVVNDLGRAGYRNEADIVGLLDLVKAGDPEATALLNQIGRFAEDAVVRFRGLSPTEQFIVRDAIFVYGWMRAAARFTLQFPLNRPVTSAVLFHMGQYGWEKLQDEFQALAWEQQGAIPIGQRSTANGFLRKIVDLSQLFPFKSGIDMLRPIFQIMGLQDSGLRPASFADLLSPSAEFAMRAVYGADPRYGTSVWEGLTYDLDPRNLPGVSGRRDWGPLAHRDEAARRSRPLGDRAQLRLRAAGPVRDQAVGVVRALARSAADEHPRARPRAEQRHAAGRATRHGREDERKRSVAGRHPGHQRRLLAGHLLIAAADEAASRGHAQERRVPHAHAAHGDEGEDVAALLPRGVRGDAGLDAGPRHDERRGQGDVGADVGRRMDGQRLRRASRRARHDQGHARLRGSRALAHPLQALAA
jgi:hypothetical protein